LSHFVEVYGHFSRLDEIHVCYDILFIEYQLVMLSTIELGRFQTEANIVKELGVFILVCVEKVPELEDDVVKKIVHHDVLFYHRRALVQVFIIQRD